MIGLLSDLLSDLLIKRFYITIDDIQIIVGGITPFIVTESGQRATRGGDIDGHTLISVRDGEVIFDGAERFKISR